MEKINNLDDIIESTLEKEDKNVEEASNKFNKEVGKSVKVTMEPGW